MNNRDGGLTPETIDEQVEHLLRGGKQADAPTPLTRAARDLQRVYEEDERLEHIWTRINTHVQSLDKTTQATFSENQNKIQIFQGEQKAMQDAPSPSEMPGSFQGTPDGPKRSLRRRRWLNLGTGLAAALILIAVFTWLVVPMFQRTQTGSGGGTPVQPTQAPVQPTPTQMPVQATPTQASGWPTAQPAVKPKPTAKPTPTQASGWPTAQPTQKPVTPVPSVQATPTATPIPATPTATPTK